ncbi:hypothetical protein [Saccharothrix hoggarensis]|uniref:Uncharacterized protein n=1 Tax=Saccharothrix hoggarensis TaxID=913853 RepID=A0ABW3QS87_9PSEU
MSPDRFAGSKPLPDDLVEYVDKVGALHVDGQLGGYVRVKLDSVYWATGVLKRRRTAAEDRIFLDIVLVRPDGTHLEWIADGPLEESDARQQLASQSMMIRGVPHELTWLHGEPADEAVAHFE